MFESFRDDRSTLHWAQPDHTEHSLATHSCPPRSPCLRENSSAPSLRFGHRCDGQTPLRAVSRALTNSSQFLRSTPHRIETLQRRPRCSDPIFVFVREATDFVGGTTKHVAQRTKLVAGRTKFVGGTTKHVAGRTNHVVATTKRVAERTKLVAPRTKFVGATTKRVAAPTKSSFETKQATRLTPFASGLSAVRFARLLVF